VGKGRGGSVSSLDRSTVKVKQKELQAFRRMLLELKKKLSSNINHLQEGGLRAGSGGGVELTDLTPEHMAEHGSENFAQHLMVKILQDCDTEMCDVNLALQKIEEETFGLCEECGKHISRKRLKALPFARLCIACKQEEERRAAQM